MRERETAKLSADGDGARRALMSYAMLGLVAMKATRRAFNSCKCLSHLKQVVLGLFLKRVEVCCGVSSCSRYAIVNLKFISFTDNFPTRKDRKTTKLITDFHLPFDAANV